MSLTAARLALVLLPLAGTAFAHGPRVPSRAISAAPTPGLAGRTMLYVVHHAPGREYLISNQVRIAERDGFDLLVLGYPQDEEAAVALGVKPGNFIPADIGDHSPENVAAIRERVRALAAIRPIHAVKNFLNAYPLLEAELAEELGVLGSPVEAVRTAVDKGSARRAMNESRHAELHLPAVEVAITGDAEGDAGRAAYAHHAIRAAGYRRSVAKPNNGGGGWGVKLGLRSPAQAAAAQRALRRDIEVLRRDNPRLAADKGLDRTVSVLHEAQIPEGLMLDVEGVLDGGEVRSLWTSYNPPSKGGTVERGTTYGAGLLPQGLEALVRDRVGKALNAVGLRTTNFHVESIVTRVKGSLAAPIVEINPRMGGADIWENVGDVSGVDMMDVGTAAAFGARREAAPAPAAHLTQHRFLLAAVDGEVVSVDGPPELKTYVRAGDHVRRDSWLGDVTLPGRDEAAALRQVLEVLARSRVTIIAPDGRRVVQTGLYGHRTPDAHVLAKDQVKELTWGPAGRALSVLRSWARAALLWLTHPGPAVRVES